MKNVYIKEQFKRWKKELGIKTDEQLSWATGVPISTLRKWKYLVVEPSEENMKKVRKTLLKASKEK
jgi:hypothetical protein